MARETKVGLLAGLAFIICFAVILANRGSNAPPGLANPFLPNGGLDFPKRIQRQQATQDGSPSTLRQIPRNSEAALPRTVNSNVPIQSGGALNSMVLENGPGNPTTAGPNGVNVPTSLADNTRPGDVAADVHRGLQDGFILRHSTTAPNRPDGNVTMAATMPAGQSVVPTQVAPEVRHTGQSPEPISHRVVSHTVAPGDTLSKIAAARYGTKSQSVVEAIYQANRQVLKDMDSLRVGMVLTIPPIDGATQSPSQEKFPASASDRSADSRRQPSVVPEPHTESGQKSKVEGVSKSSSNRGEGPQYRWYQVKKKDGFASIAREQLGDAKRWKELYELNKDKFPDPEKIREGVRIKIPNTSLAEAGKEKRR